MNIIIWLIIICSITVFISGLGAGISAYFDKKKISFILLAIMAMTSVIYTLLWTML